MRSIPETRKLNNAGGIVMSLKARFADLKKNTDPQYVRAENLSVSLLFIACIMVAIVMVSGGGIAKLLSRPTPIIVMVITAILYILPIKAKTKGGIYAFIIAVAGLAEFLAGNNSGNAQYIIAVGLVITGLYFNYKMLFTIAAVTTAGMTVLLIIGKITIPTPVATINLFVIYFMLVAAMYFLIRWGNESLNRAQENEKTALASEKEATEKEREVKHLFSKLQETFGAVNDTVGCITSTSTQIASSSQSLAESTTEQAATLQEINASLEEITFQAKKNSTNVSTVLRLVSEANQKAEIGSVMISEMQHTMSDIDESSRSISRITKVIDDIAFQTNILALNAAVEAARAGIHGKGFAVVADEVRNLAAKSAQAAKQTDALISSSQITVGKGVISAQNAAEALDHITNIISELDQNIQTISDNTSDTAESVDQISIAVSQLSQALTYNSTSAEEYANSSRSLLDMSENLVSIVAV